jgi:uncharacterized protein (TIGR02996 family)
MNEEAAFLRAICEHPDEDTPRLVFADWLTEQGGPVNTAWAGGIRAQVWLARGATDDAIRFQTCVFESPFGQRKLLERLGFNSELLTCWDRGFPTEATGLFREINHAWPRLAFRIPLRRLQVYDADAADAVEFATWPGLSVLRELVFGVLWERPAPADVLPALATCAELKGLVTLEVQGGLLSDSGVSAILDSPHLAGLKTCALNYGLRANPFSQQVRDRFQARFGPDLLNDDDIPF